MFKDTSEGQTHSYGDGCNEEHGKISDQELILSLQKQVQDLRENARKYARKDLSIEFGDEIQKEIDSCKDDSFIPCERCVGLRFAWVLIDKILKQ